VTTPPDGSPPDWLDDARHVWLPYTQMKTAPAPLPAVRTEGVRITLADGRVLIDGVSSWWTACHGYNHPHIAAAVRAQLDAMPHVMLGGLVHAPAARLARRLTDAIPGFGGGGRVFFSESGSVSVEVALKMAAQYWINRGQPARTGFVSFTGGYHGDTFMCMSVCDPEEGMHALFKGVVPAQRVVPLPHTPDALRDFERFLAAHRETVAAVVMEPLVQGAGGMVFHSPEVLRGIADACQRQDVLLILDEIMTGFGRTGSMFACEQAEVVPDIVTVSKALTGGTMPLAATVAREHVFDAFLSDDPERCLMHGPTYTGNPLACAAANASLDLFESEPRVERAQAMEDTLGRLLEPSRRLPGVVDVRARGAIGVVQLDRIRDLDGMRGRFVERGAWIRPFRDIVYVMPPLIIEDADLETLAGAIYDELRD
jgi:adenosylmethionine-8-amino-7-oxononanoate aminotransferase